MGPVDTYIIASLDDSSNLTRKAFHQVLILSKSDPATCSDLTPPEWVQVGLNLENCVCVRVCVYVKGKGGRGLSDKLTTRYKRFKLHTREGKCLS